MTAADPSPRAVAVKGHVVLGMTVAIQAIHVEGRARKDLDTDVRELLAQATVALGRYVGGVKPVGDLSVKMDGPHDDPLQGRIYGVSVAAPFALDAFPPDSEAYALLSGRSGA